MSLDVIVDQVEALGNFHVVLTGGEPMLFDPITDLAVRLRTRGKVITVETAGTVHRTLACDLMSISPKLAHSAPPESSGWRDRHETTRLNLEPIVQLMREYAFQLKFVVSGPTDFEEIETWLDKIVAAGATRPPATSILVMPEGVDSYTLKVAMRNLVEPVIARGWRLCPRLHVDLFGNIRGT